MEDFKYPEEVQACFIDNMTLEPLRAKRVRWKRLARKNGNNGTGHHTQELLSCKKWAEEYKKWQDQIYTGPNHSGDQAYTVAATETETINGIREIIDMEKKAQEWNENFPVGTLVKYYPYGVRHRYFFKAKIKSEAFNMAGGEFMVLLEGYGYVPIGSVGKFSRTETIEPQNR